MRVTKPDGANSFKASMSSLLSPLVSRQIPDEKVGLQRQVQRLSEMLQESEEKVIALKSQEKVTNKTSSSFWMTKMILGTKR